jgi:hypothetical protein
VIKQLTLTGALVFIALWFGACTSLTNDSVSDPSSSQSAAAVPGEKLNDERYSPGPMGSSNVRW